MGVKEKLQDLEYVFRDRGAVAVYLYGSYAEGRSDEKSDIDVGVLFESYEGLKQLVELEKELDSMFDAEVDVRALNVDDIVFKKEVIKKGELVFESDRERRIEFETSVMRRYMDMKLYIERYNEMRSERLEALKA